MLSSILFNVLWIGTITGALGLIVATIAAALKDKPFKGFVAGAAACFIAGIVVAVVYITLPAPSTNGAYRDVFAEMPGHSMDWAGAPDDAFMHDYHNHYDMPPLAEQPILTAMQQYLLDNNWDVSDIVAAPSLLINRLNGLLAAGEQVISLGWDDDSPTTLVAKVDIGDISALEHSMGEQAAPFAASTATRRISEGLLGLIELDAYWENLRISVAGIGDVVFWPHHVQGVDMWRFMDDDYIHYAFFERVDAAATVDFTHYEAYNEAAAPAHGLVDSWALGNTIYYVFNDNGRGSMAMIGIQWWADNGTLTICRTRFHCRNTCSNPFTWNYSINGNYLILTSPGAQGVSYTFTRASAIGAIEYARPESFQGHSESKTWFRESVAANFIGNRGTSVFHRPTCHTLPAPHNRVRFATREAAINAGHRPCQNCNP